MIGMAYGAFVLLNPIALIVVRVLAGLSQAALARKAEVSQGYLSSIESGSRRPSPEMLLKLASTMGVPVAALLADPSLEEVTEARAALSRRVPGTKALAVS